MKLKIYFSCNVNELFDTESKGKMSIQFNGKNDEQYNLFSSK